MAQMMEKKVLWIFNRSHATVLLGGLIVTTIVALIWSWVMSQGFSDNSWVKIIELLLGAVVVGALYGWIAGSVGKLTLWEAAGLAVVGQVLTYAFVGAGAAGYEVGDSLLSGLGTEAFALSVSVGSIVLGVVAAASTGLGAKMKM